jgi:hypothetical protein
MPFHYTVYTLNCEEINNNTKVVVEGCIIFYSDRFKSSYLESDDYVIYLKNLDKPYEIGDCLKVEGRFLRTDILRYIDVTSLELTSKKNISLSFPKLKTLKGCKRGRLMRVEDMNVTNTSLTQPTYPLAIFTFKESRLKGFIPLDLLNTTPEFFINKKVTIKGFILSPERNWVRILSIE